MSRQLRVALFVEGSEDPSSARGRQHLADIWNKGLGKALGLPPFDPVEPISKLHLLAMDPRNPPMSGTQEPLDQLVARKLRRDPFDAAVVAWDLIPAWDPERSACRWALQGWPARGWDDPRERRPDENVLLNAVLAASRLHPKPAVFRQVRGDMRTNKGLWGEFLLRRLLADPRAGGKVRTHAFSRRLQEVAKQP